MLDVRLTVTSNHFPELARRYPALARAIVQKTGLDIEAAAKMRAPVDTGALRNSITGAMTGEAEGEVAVGVEYGPYVEFGTRSASAQPYLTPAVEAARPEFERAVAAALDS